MQRAPHNNILATPDFQEWKYLRKMTNPAFSPENMRKVSLIIIITKTLSSSWCGTSLVCPKQSALPSSIQPGFKHQAQHLLVAHHGCLHMLLHIPTASLDPQVDVLDMLCVHQWEQHPHDCVCMLPFSSEQRLICANMYDKLLQHCHHSRKSAHQPCMLCSSRLQSTAAHPSAASQAGTRWSKVMIRSGVCLCNTMSPCRCCRRIPRSTNVRAAPQMYCTRCADGVLST